MRPFVKPLLSLLAIIPVVGWAPMPLQTQIIYVNRCGGVPVGAPGAGSQANPYSTVTSAVNEAIAGSTLVVQAGTYAEPITIQKNLTVTASGGPVRIVARPASTQKVCQLTGEFDKERNVNTVNRTETNFMLKGTDLGASLDHNGRTYILFGDTEPTGGNNGDRPRAGDSIAWTQDTDPEQCVRLNFLRAQDGGYLSPTVREPDGTYISLGGFEVPTSGFSANGYMYVFFTTNYVSDQGLMGRSVLARLDDEAQNRFTYLYDVSCLPGIPCDHPAVGRFINVSPVKVNNADIPGLPQSTGQGLLLWGSGLYRQSNPYLAYLSLDAVESRQQWSYAVIDGSGNLQRWSSSESEATRLFEQPCIGEFSVTWNAFLQKWLMLYNCLEPRGINFRVANRPWGPWSPPALLFDPGCDRGYCHFMHVNWDVRNCDSVYDSMFGPSREREWGGEYGPYVISRFTKGDATSTTIYYLMSTWNPYQVMLMKSTLQLSCACRTY